MTTHLLRRLNPISDMRTMCDEPLKSKKLGRHLVGSEDGIVHVDCVGCLRELITLLRMEAAGHFGGASRRSQRVSEAQARWLAGGDTGTSSKTIWSVMTGHPVDRYDTPYDPADFGRCHRLLEQFPEWRERLPEVATKYPNWAGLIEHWDELAALYVEEFPTGSGPKLYVRMKELLAPY